MADLRVRFRNFHKSFNVENNFFTNVLTFSGLKIKLINGPHGEVDLQINGPFNFGPSKYFKKLFPKSSSNFSRNSLWKSKINIFYTGENVRPPFSDYYYKCFTFDEDSLNGRNIYFPLWMLEIDWFDTNLKMSRLDLILKPEALIRPRHFPRGKLNEICTFIGNAESIRLEAIREFQGLVNVSIYGKFANKFIANKLDVSKKFIWNLCFENDLYPGYVTEKLLEAYLCGNIPIYRGLLAKNSPFNPSSFINVIGFGSIQECAQFIANLDSRKIENIYEQPIMSFMPSIDQIKSNLLSCIPAQS